MVYSHIRQSGHAPDCRGLKPEEQFVRRHYPERDAFSGRCRKTRARHSLKLNRQRHTTRERGPQSQRESARRFAASRTRPGCRRGDGSLARIERLEGSRTPPPAPSLKPQKTSSPAALRRAVKLSPQGHTTVAHRYSARRSRQRSRAANRMKPVTVTPTRTTHVRASQTRIRRVRARLRQLHRRRPSSSNARTK